MLALVCASMWDFTWMLDTAMAVLLAVVHAVWLQAHAQDLDDTE